MIKKLILNTVKLSCLALMVSISILLLLNYLYPFPNELLILHKKGQSFLLLDKENQSIAWRVGQKDQWQFRRSFDSISKHVINGTIAVEDHRFYEHHGIDLLALSRAVYQNIINMRRVSGASTISMQTIKLLYGGERSWKNKCFESFRTLQLEIQCNKEEILEIYLSLAPYGGNTVGIEAAARRYFGKSAEMLTLAEASLLVGIPQRPVYFNPIQNHKHALKRRIYVLSKMEALNYVTSAQAKQAGERIFELNTSYTRNDHMITANYYQNKSGFMNGIIRASLDPKIQSICEGIVKKHSFKIEDHGIDSMGMIVIDVKNASLSAMLTGLPGSDKWINGATVMRQPGSLLKPFLYAQAYQEGIIAPDSLVYDFPYSRGDYRPQNFDHQFSGPISAALALSSSKNIPAVRLYERLGFKVFSNKLSKLGLELPYAESYYGLSLALGTQEYSLLNLCNAYATLARKGIYKKLNCFEGKNTSEEVRVFTPQASYLTLLSLGANRVGESYSFASKTGTSWDHRDAWAIAVSPEYVVGIWLGQLSGSPNPFLTGGIVSLPIVTDSINIIRRHSVKSVWKKPSGVEEVKLCSLSGTRPSSYCEKINEGYIISGTTSSYPCKHHEQKNKVTWPKEHAHHFKSTHTQNDSKLKILYPVSKSKFLVDLGNKQSEKILLRSSLPKRKLFWFVNGELLVANKNGYEFNLKPGEHELTVSDGVGNSDRVKILVRSIGI
jgi:penicillin-binding protein 1C